MPADPHDPLRRYWHPVAWSHDVSGGPKPVPLLGERLVVWRDGDGTVRCFDDLCIHRGTALSLGEVVDGCLVCPYHGWRFDRAGACVHIPQFAPDARIPSTAAARSHRCEEAAGLVWVALDEPVAPIPTFPEWDDPAYRHVPCPDYTWATSAPRMVENFTDFGHLGWLHDGLLGSRDALEVPSHRVRQEGLELHYEITMQVPNTNDRFAVTDLSGDRGLQPNTYVLPLPHTIWLRCRTTPQRAPDAVLLRRPTRPPAAPASATSPATSRSTTTTPPTRRSRTSSPSRTGWSSRASVPRSCPSTCRPSCTCRSTAWPSRTGAGWPGSAEGRWWKGACSSRSRARSAGS